MVDALKGGEIIGYTSPITVVEACYFVSRNFPPRKRESGEEARAKAVAKILQELGKLRLVYASPSGDYPLPLDGRGLVMPPMLHQALTLTFLGLRTLDLLHLASARHARRTGEDLRGFVTGDNDFIDNRRALANVIDMPILSPRDLVETAGLNGT